MRLVDADAFFKEMKLSDISFMRQDDALIRIKDVLDRQPIIYYKSTDTIKYLVVRPNDIIEVLLLKNRDEDTWSFVNITNGHVCPCKFESIDNALEDMDRYVREGKIIRYQRVD